MMCACSLQRVLVGAAVGPPVLRIRCAGALFALRCRGCAGFLLRFVMKWFLFVCSTVCWRCLVSRIPCTGALFVLFCSSPLVAMLGFVMKWPRRLGLRSCLRNCHVRLVPVVCNMSRSAVCDFVCLDPPCRYAVSRVPVARFGFVLTWGACFVRGWFCCLGWLVG